MNASPFPYQKLEPAVTQGISHKILERIENARKIQHFYISKAINQYSAETTGFLRPGELEAARANVISKLPTEAEVVESTPFGLKVRVVTPNAEKFVSPEDLALANRRYEVWNDAYRQAMDELDRFYDEAKNGKFEPDPEWVNRLERNKDRAKAEMDKAYRTLTKGIQPDAVD